MIFINKFFNSLRIYANLQIIKICYFGFISGLLLLLSGNTLNFWLAKEGVNVKTIGLISLVALPYTIKFLFAPLIDRYNVPVIGKIFNHRQSWMVFSLIAITGLLSYISKLLPIYDLLQLVIATFLISFFSAIIDITLNSYRIENVDPEFISYASSSYILGYRIGMLVSGAGAILLSAYISWNEVFLAMSLFSFIFLISFIFIKDKTNIKNETELNSNSFNRGLLFSSFIEPFEHFKKISNFIYIIVFLALYRISDNMILVMLNRLLLDLDFNEIQIATAGKFFGSSASVIGTIIAGSLTQYWGIKKSLLYFAIFHLLTHFLYFPLIYYKNNINILFIITGFEALTGGMKMAIYITFMTSLCKGNKIGTQYSLLFSVMAASRVVFPSISGYLVAYNGWNVFFIMMIILSLPSIFMIKKINKMNI